MTVSALFAPPSAQLVQAVQTIWQAIAPDVCWVEEAPSNASAIEVCIDAGRLTPEAGIIEHPAAYYDWQRMTAESGYDSALAILAAHPALQLV